MPVKKEVDWELFVSMALIGRLPFDKMAQELGIDRTTLCRRYPKELPAETVKKIRNRFSEEEQFKRFDWDLYRELAEAGYRKEEIAKAMNTNHTTILRFRHMLPQNAQEELLEIHRRARANRAPCGTFAKWKAHKKAGDPFCAPCDEAGRKYMRIQSLAKHAKAFRREVDQWREKLG